MKVVVRTYKSRGRFIRNNNNRSLKNPLKKLFHSLWLKCNQVFLKNMYLLCKYR